ncbi:MAG: aminotransferase class I/II-fold pyridoxal phosphate-dependent enzyme [Saprospiraceae bacterium]
MEINDILFHKGENRKKYYNAVVPPIIQSSNFVFDSVDEMRNAISDEMNHHIYTRGNNPTVEILRKKIAALEHAEDAIVTSSGSSAISIAVMSNVSAGDHIICVNKPYAWTYKLITILLARFGVEHTFVDGSDIYNIKKAIRPNTKLLYLESPNSLTFELQDLKACAKLAKANNITTIIDNSHCSPIFQNPIDFGIDLVIHSGTKYLNGHSDVLIGTICGSKTLIKNIFVNEFMTLGVNISPHDAALVIRGLRTLPLRLHRSDESAKKIVTWLEKHPKIKKVIYPFSNNFTQQELAKKQMKGNGGLFTIELNTDNKEAVYRFTNAISKFLIAVSWGGYESLMIPSITFHDMDGMPDSPIPWTYVRLYVGLEDPEYLITDLAQALEKV